MDIPRSCRDFPSSYTVVKGLYEGYIGLRNMKRGFHYGYQRIGTISQV